MVMASRQSLARAAVEYKEAKLVLLKATNVWLDLLINEPAIDSDFDEFYRETGRRRPGPSGLIKDVLMRCRDSVGHLLHPETGYLLPLTVLLTAMASLILQCLLAAIGTPAMLTVFALSATTFALVWLF